jgi:hypothetical protein
MSKPHIFISTPAHDGQHSILHFNCVLALVGCGWFKVTRSAVKGGGIAKARNDSIPDFLRSGADYYFSLDGDIIFDPHAVKRLIDHDRDIACGLYCHKKEGPIVWSANSLPEMEVDGDLQSMANTGMGFVLIKRAVIEHMIKAYPERRFVENGEEKHELFPMGIVCDGKEYKEPTYVTEDFYFFYLARKLGYKVWADTRCVVRHEGSVLFPLEADMKAAG